jgi:hypothetical protein
MYEAKEQRSHRANKLIYFLMTQAYHERLMKINTCASTKLRWQLTPINVQYRLSRLSNPQIREIVDTTDVQTLILDLTIPKEVS